MSAETQIRAILPVGARNRPADRILRISGVGIMVILVVFLAFLLRHGGSSATNSKEKGGFGQIAEITGPEADAVLRALSASDSGTEKKLQNDARPPEAVLLDELVKFPPIVPKLPLAAPTTPVEIDEVFRRKTESEIMVYRTRRASGDNSTALQTANGFDTQTTSRQTSELAQRLVPMSAKSESAFALPNLETRLLQGTLISCVLETAISSAVPGMTTCRTRTPVYSATGEFELLPRGSRIVGEYQGGIEDGQVRIFVLWNRLVTPDGMAVSLASPGAGPLGRGGHTGWVDRKWRDRIAAAMMISLISDASIAELNGEFQSAQAAAEAAAKEYVRSELAIRPEITKHQGERITIIVARDVDFEEVMRSRFDLAARREGLLVFTE